MTTKDIAEIDQLMKIKMAELDQILDRASRVASSLTNYTGFAIKPRARQITVSKYETAMIDNHSFVLIAVASNGTVKTRNLITPAEIDESILARLTAALNELLSHVDSEQISLSVMMEFESRMGGDNLLVGTVMKGIYELLGDLNGGDLKVSGLDRLLQYPEFADTQNLGELLGALERKDDILDIVGGAEGDGVSVVIGSESSVRVINNSTFVFKPIRAGGKTVGAIGVIGPLRMDYARVLATLEGLGGNIAHLLKESPREEGEGNG